MKSKLLVLGLLTGSFLLAGCAPPRYWHEGYRGPRHHDRDRDHDRDSRAERPR